MNNPEVLLALHKYLKGETTADTLPSSEQITNAMNDYYQLLEALKAIKKQLSGMVGDMELRQMERLAQQAVAEAEGAK